MNVQRILIAVIGIAVIALAYRAYGWPGIAIASGGIVMWALLNLTRTVTILQRAAQHPVGYVASAVMLNAKLKPRATFAAHHCDDACVGADAVGRKRAARDLPLDRCGRLACDLRIRTRPTRTLAVGATFLR